MIAIKFVVPPPCKGCGRPVQPGEQVCSSKCLRDYMVTLALWPKVFKITVGKA